MEQGCPGCDEKAAAIKQYCKGFCSYSPHCESCPLSPHGGRKYINKVLAGDMPGVPAETQAKIMGELL